MGETLKSILLGPEGEPERTRRELTAQFFPPQAASVSRRSSTELWRLANESERRQRKASEAEAARRRAERERLAIEQHEQQLQIIAEHPDATFRRIDAAVEERNRPAYRRAAFELKLVQEALGPIFARSKAEELKNRYPTRSALHAEIRNALDGWNGGIGFQPVIRAITG
ncbi:hypothetical protein RESH_03791 [Rhodopirellula europaea SH398]|uniref:Uncharacterized protein n=1 Tax=Rhodopirellula europaea SH398 TaxID=1263868 RepID=M5S1T5_9BACT|nr:hypothetical protein RESH_03791 [Rhodopirellula europaea SH398]